MSSLRPEDQAFFRPRHPLPQRSQRHDRRQGAALARERRAALRFAAARYNAFTWMHREAMDEQTEEGAVEFFADGARALTANTEPLRPYPNR